MDLSKAAAIYTRISRDAEGDSAGVARQEQLCRELAQRLNLDVVAVYSDNDIGASERTSKTKIREGFNEIIAATHRREFTSIIAYSNSRLTRRMRELEDLIKLHEQTGVVIRTVVSGDDDLSTGDGRMVARIKASVDAAESDRISERQQAAFLHNAMKGKPKLQHQRPFGWKQDGVTLEPKEADRMREAVEQIKQGVSITTLCKEWMQAGIKTASGNDKWEWRTMKNVLLGWRAAGVRTYRREPLQDESGEYVMGQWEQIITLEDRDAALAMLKKRGLTKVRQGTWLLKGLVTCGECGGKMYGQLTGTPTYACKPGNGHNSITAAKLEKFVQFAVAFRVRNRILRQTETPQVEEAAEPVDWPKQDELEVTNKQIEELMAAFKANQLSGEVVFPQVKELDQKRGELHKEREDFYAMQAEPDEIAIPNLDDWIFDNILIHDSPITLDGVKLDFGEDEDRETKILFMKREIKSVVIHKGERGRAGWGKEAFEKRVEILWNEQARSNTNE